ncbi:hypothetical protein TRFO_06172 [Tritrichomonas foetus]|uniref:Nuclear pore protein n=1 Tax=Tritrichomonas foetus TaxID=1144522 RepID=A0A1J4K4U8_9EUKA|nr:hypothetical protein TRFO_06172 [Tritrichomonas foetus]|eukprot:OHT04740.1 hypothetical protein TRFO_06172 [Tritrichomonas foetus]
MDVKPEALLDNIYARSKRLEKILPFRIQLPISTVHHQSRKVLNTSRGADDTRIGYYLLAQQNISLDRNPEILNQITNLKLIQENYIPFQKRANFYFENVIVSSISNSQESTEKLNSDFLLKAYQRKKAIQAKSRDLSKSKFPTAVPIYNLDPSLLKMYPESVKMELTKISKFYCELLPKFDEDIARNISEAILTTNEKLYNYELQNYLADTFNLIYLIKCRHSFVDASIQFLESQKKRLIRDEVNSNLRYAGRGGSIGIIHTIKGYLNHKHNKYVNSPWATVYFAIRCGEAKAAAEFATTVNFDADVVAAIQQYANNIPLMGKIRETLVTYLNSEFSSSKYDKYKVLTLSILTKYSNIPKDGKSKIQDWIWQKLQFTNDSSSLATELKDVDEPLLRGQILIMSGLFEDAAKWFLGRMDDVKDNLHIVLAMHVSGLIKSDLLLEPLINHSIEVFKANPKAAIQYLALINDSHKLDAIASLVIKAERGYIMFDNINGQTAPIAEVLIPEEQTSVLRLAGKKARHLNLYDLCIRLYKLAGDYESILEIDCIKLKQFIEGYGQSDILNNIIGEHFASIQERATTLSSRSIEIMRMLIKIACACEYSRRNMYHQAAQEFEETGLFPTTPILVSSKYDSYRSLPEIVRQIVPVIIVPTLEAYYQMFILSKSSQEREILKQKSEAIKDFSSYLDIYNETQAQILDLYRQIQ